LLLSISYYHIEAVIRELLCAVVIFRVHIVVVLLLCCSQKAEVVPTTGERRLNMTRVDANELVDQLMSGINFDREATEESKRNIFSSFLL